MVGSSCGGGGGRRGSSSVGGRRHVAWRTRFRENERGRWRLEQRSMAEGLWGGVGPLVLAPGQAALAALLQHVLHLLYLVAHDHVLTPSWQRGPWRGGLPAVVGMVAVLGVGPGGDVAGRLSHQQVMENMQDGVDVTAWLSTPVLQARVQGAWNIAHKAIYKNTIQNLHTRKSALLLYANKTNVSLLLCMVILYTIWC